MKSVVEDILFGLYRISRTLRKVPLEHDGLSMHHWFALHVIGEGQANISALAKELNVALPTATALVEQLVQSGMVERAVSATDRRVTVLSLTPAGKQQITKAKSERLARATELFSVLSSTEVAELKRLIEAVAHQGETAKKESEVKV